MGNSALTITVVIPVYNVAPYVERCMKSVMGQTMPAAECIIVDDATPDDSIERCQRLINEYSGPTRFIIHHHEKNQGLSVARNSGMDAATSDYIYFLDGDDEMTYDCLEKLAAPIVSDYSIEMVMGGFRTENIATGDSKHEWNQQIENSPLELQSNEDVQKWYYHVKIPRPVYVWNKLLKLSFVKTNHLYNKEGVLGEDLLWTYYLIGCLRHTVIIHDETYVYYSRPDSIVSNTKHEEMIRYYGSIHREIADQINPGKRKEEAERWVLNFCRYYIDAYDNTDYQYAYYNYYQKMKEAKNQTGAYILKVTHYMKESSVGRTLFRGAMKLRVLVALLFRFFY